MEDQQDIHPERLKARQDLIKGYKKLHCDSPEYIQGYVNNIRAYVSNPFFIQIGKDISENPNVFVTGEILNAEWLKKLFSKSNDPKNIGNFQKIIIGKYYALAEEKYAQFQEINANSDTKKVNDFEGVELKKIKKSSESIKSVENTSSNILSDYYKNLQLRFEFIHLNVANFKMHISHFINTPLLKRDLDLTEELKFLENKFDELEISAPESTERIDNLSKRIYKVRTILGKKYDIIDIIDIGKDIFIEAPAGTGKSTMLRWLTYQFAINPRGFYPVFIELMYNSNDNLHELVEDSCNPIVLKQKLKTKDKILLFLDGFDQFNGNKVKLFKDIKSLKQSNVQIIFSGREVPNVTRYNLDLVIYNLQSFTDSDIKKLCVAYLEEEKGVFYSEYFRIRNLNKYISKPLYLCFILAHIKRLIDKKYTSDDIIDTLNVANKGKLLYKVIVNYFIGQYEEDVHNTVSSEQCILEKKKQLKLINLIAYKMTFTFRDSETLTWEMAIQQIELYYYDNKELEKHNAETVLKEFVKHNILHLHKEQLSFDKKELRLFFTALYLKNKVKSFKDFKKYKTKFNRRVRNGNTWKSIQQYLIGLLNPDLFLNSFEKIDFDNRVLLLDRTFIEQFDLSIELVQQKNIPKFQNGIVNETYLIEIIKLVFEKLNSVKNNTNGGNTLTYLLCPIPRFLIKKLNIPNKYISKKVEDLLNCQFVQHEYYHNLNWGFQRFSYYLINYDLGLNFEELLKITCVINEEDFAFERHLYDRILSKDPTTCIILETKEKVSIAFDYEFNFHNSVKYAEVFKYKSLRLKLFMDDVRFYYSSDFFNLIFEKIDTINKYKLSKFLFKIIITPKNGYWFKFDDSLLEENAKKIFLYIIRILKKEKQSLSSLSFIIDYSSNQYLIDLFLNYFKQVLSEESYSKEEKIIAFSYLQNIRFLVEAYENNHLEIVRIVNHIHESNSQKFIDTLKQFLK